MPALLDGISGPVRAERYRRFAAETLRIARAADSAEIRATYVSLAACWKKLAENAATFGNEADDRAA